MKKLLIVDGNSILNRAYYGIRMLTNGRGLPTNALYGMVNILMKQVEALSPDYTAVAFDLKAPTFRHKMYDAYKAGRKPMPEELAVQLPLSKELCRAMGFTVIEKEGFEADDILGTIAHLAHESEDTTAFILTGDRDSLQLITEDGRVNVLLAGNSETTMFGASKFKDKYGVSPTVFVDVKAIMGDSSDNIPGVAGIGEKGALKLVAEFGTLDNIYKNIDSPSISQSIKKKLCDGKESAYLSLELAKIRRDVPLEMSLDDLTNNGANKEELGKLFREYGFSTFIKRFGIDDDKRESRLSEVDIRSVSVAELPKTGRVCVFLSDDALFLYDGKDILKACDAPERYFESTEAEIVTHDCKTLYKMLDQKGVKYRTCAFDTMLAAYFANAASGKFDLSHLALEYLEISDIKEGEEVLVISELEKLITKKLESEGTLEACKTLEFPLAAVLADMESNGFKIDTNGLEGYGRSIDIALSELEKRIFFSAGCEFNINSPSQLGEILFEKLGLPSGKKTSSGKYSTNAEILEKLRGKHHVIEDILDYRKLMKLKGTYIDGLAKVADSEGKIHTNFNQTGTVTGRLSSSEPNLQNIPIRTDEGRELRKFFIPEKDGYLLVDADYSQIELRVLASISGDAAMRAAFAAGEDIHASTAAKIFGVAPNMVTSEQRKRAKAINFGIVYGMGEFSLSEDLGISRAEAKKYIESYFESFPGISSYLADTVKKAYDNGYTTTLFGRRRYIPELAGQNKMLKNFGERVAKNSPIQGTAAEIIKLAMIKVQAALEESGIDAKLILQIHDELILESAPECADKAARLLEECMENAFALDGVKLCAKACIGKNWFECK